MLTLWSVLVLAPQYSDGDTIPVLSRWGIFVAIDKIHCMSQNYLFFIYAKNH